MSEQKQEANKRRHDFLIDVFFDGKSEGYEELPVGEKWVLVKFWLNDRWAVAIYTSDAFKRYKGFVDNFRKNGEN